jgi:CobQ-like glutamine amidotransferase family enzyme
MKIEILYPEAGNLYGDTANIKYLRLCLPEAEIIETSLGSVPAFTKEKIDLIYSGPMTERAQELAAAALMPYADKINELIDSGTHLLFTGNSLELLGSHIVTDGGDIKCLGILSFYSKRFMAKRYNGFFLGSYEDIKITGFNSRFSHSYPEGELNGFAAVIRGIGLNEGCGFEGVKKNSFIGTYLLGPLLPLNPLFTRKLLASLGATEAQPAFFDASMDAYNKRLSEFMDKKRRLD